jgi:hypothetical protein
MGILELTESEYQIILWSPLIFFILGAVNCWLVIRIFRRMK